MTDRPILFQGAMVRALLDGTKTQTRRVLKPQPPLTWPIGGASIYPDDAKTLVWQNGHDGSVLGKVEGKTYKIGDRLWVRESFSGPCCFDDCPPTGWLSEFNAFSVPIHYWADGEVKAGDWTKPRPSIHMPRWASRITLEVTDVRVQRVQDISGSDATDEGVERGHRPNWHYSRPFKDYSGKGKWTYSTQDSFKTLWNSINKKRGFGWDTNPWVVVYTFKVHKCNIDQMVAA